MLILVTNLDGAQGLVSKLALLVDVEAPGDELHRLADVALGLQRHQAAVHQQVSVLGVHLHTRLVQLVSLVKLLNN